MYAALICIVLVAALLGVGVLAYQFLIQGKRAFGGFRDWLKYLDYQQSAADYFAARSALQVPDNISEEELRQMVELLYVRADENFNFDRLKLAGDKAVPLLIEALDNPQTTAMRFDRQDHVADAQSPFERICDLLQPISPADAAQPLAKYMDHEDGSFRKHAALVLGNIGTPVCITPMLKALDDSDDYVRSYAMMGIERGLEARRCTPEFLDAAFPAIAQLLNRDDLANSGMAPKLLLAIDAQRALPILLSPTYFTIQNRQVHHILRAMNTGGFTIPHDALLPFLDANKPLIGKYPYGYSYAAALIAYARNPDPAAEERFRSDLDATDEDVQAAAAEALAILSGVRNAREIVFSAIKKRGFQHLPASHQHYYAVFMYDADVNNGGHSQYFANASSDHWQAALAGLKAIGANHRARILENAASLFRTPGPSSNHEQRRREVAALEPRQHQALQDLDKQYYECQEKVESLLAQYALANRDAFISL